MDLPNVEARWIAGIVGLMESWMVVEWALVLEVVRVVASVVAVAAEAGGFLDCTLRSTGDGRAEVDYIAAVDYRCYGVDLEGNLLVPECTGTGASQSVSPDGSCIAGSLVILELDVRSAAGVKGYSCVHADAEVVPEDRDHLGLAQEIFPVRLVFAYYIWFQKSRCKDFSDRCFRHCDRCSGKPSGRSGYLTAFPLPLVDRKLHFRQMSVRFPHDE